MDKKPKRSVSVWDVLLKPIREGNEKKRVEKLKREIIKRLNREW